MMARRSQSNSGSGFAVIFVLVLVVGLVVKYFWFIVAAGAVVGLVFAGRKLARHLAEQKAAAAREAERLAYQADRQHGWVSRGDTRGVYGPTGAELMRSVSLTPAVDQNAETPDPSLIAKVADTAEDLSMLLADKAPGWRWAAFASVLVQRRAGVQSRLRDCELGFATPSTIRGYTGAEVARFAADRMDDLSQLVTQVEAFMLAPAFMGVFGERADEGTADADGIVHVANRLMDYHDRFLSLAERCRDYSVPSRYADLLRDCSQLLNIPLLGYKTFITDFVELVDDMPNLMRYGRGAVDAGTVSLHMEMDDQLLKRITKQIKAATKS